MARRCRSATSRTSTTPKWSCGHPVARIHEALHEQDRRRVVGAENRTENAHRIDDGELQSLSSPPM